MRVGESHGYCSRECCISMAVVMERQSDDDDISDRLCMLGSCTYYRPITQYPIKSVEVKVRIGTNQ